MHRDIESERPGLANNEPVLAGPMLAGPIKPAGPALAAGTALNVKPLAVVVVPPAPRLMPPADDAGAN